MGNWTGNVVHQCDNPTNYHGDYKPKVGWEWLCDCGISWIVTSVYHHPVESLGTILEWRK